MKLRGKSINLFLMDAIATGRVKCTLANWTGVAYKIPRVEIDKCKDREELKQSGVYFLFGVSEDTGENIVYIGQAGARKNGEGILCRLQEHKRDENKDYWTEAVVFTTSNNSFGPIEISYLENRFFNMAKTANRYEVKNDVDPHHGYVTEEKESELEEFIEYAEIVIGTLGHRVFDSLEEKIVFKTKEDAKIDDEPLLFLKTNKVKAKGRRTNEGFVVYKGASVSASPTESCKETILNLRNRYTNRVKDKVLIKDTLFTSPSSAACFVTYSSVNGRTLWKNENGITLKEIENIDN